MKRLLFILSFVIFHLTTCMAQSDFQKTIASYKNIKKATAVVTKTRHKKALSKDQVTTGEAIVQRPDLVSISTSEGKDKLVMQGTRFTMTVGGKDHVTDSKKSPQFATFHTVLTSIINGGTTDISQLKDVSVTNTNDGFSITITPVADNGKKIKRQIFSSFVLVIDKKTAAFKLLRMVERDGSFTDYEFKNFNFE